jgi:hypothetical protein
VGLSGAAGVGCVQLVEQRGDRLSEVSVTGGLGHQAAELFGAKLAAARREAPQIDASLRDSEADPDRECLHERGEYQLAARSDAQNYLDTIARSADNASWLLPEQVWDHQPPAGTGPDFQPGEPTFSATPLAWTHAQFIRLAWSIDNGAPVETPQQVACRYSSPICGH